MEIYVQKNYVISTFYLMMSQIRSHVEYLIQIHNITVLILYQNVKK